MSHLSSPQQLIFFIVFLFIYLLSFICLNNLFLFFMRVKTSALWFRMQLMNVVQINDSILFVMKGISYLTSFRISWKAYQYLQEQCFLESLGIMLLPCSSIVTVPKHTVYVAYRLWTDKMNGKEGRDDLSRRQGLIIWGFTESSEKGRETQQIWAVCVGIKGGVSFLSQCFGSSSSQICLMLRVS